MTTIDRKTGNTSEGELKHFAKRHKEKLRWWHLGARQREVGKPLSVPDWLGRWWRGGCQWVMELRIERASLPPVQHLCSPHFGSMAVIPARKAGWTQLESFLKYPWV